MDAFWGGVLGMLAGAGIYAEVYTLVRGNLLKWGSLGKITLPSLFGINHWIVIVLLWALLVPLMRWFEKINR